jgi:hypothetical protein
MGLYKLSIEEVTKFSRNRNLKNGDDIKCYIMNKSARYVKVSIDEAKGSTKGDFTMSVNTENFYNELIKDGIPVEGVRAYIDNLNTITISSIRSFQKYLEEPFTHYIPSKPLLEVLSKVMVDMPMDMLLKKDIRFYFELKDKGVVDEWGDNAEYAIVWTEKTAVGHLLHITIIDNKKNPFHSHLPIIEGETFADRFNKGKTSTHNLGIGSSYGDSIPFKDNLIHKIIVNLIIYVLGPNEEFNAQVNRFSPNNKLRQQQQQVYTKKNFILIGEDIKFLRLISEKESSVSGHFRWQACGRALLDRKLIFINPHTRNIKKMEVDLNLKK